MMKTRILKWTLWVTLAAVVSVTAILLKDSLSQNEYLSDGEVFVVISKQELKLYVCQHVNGDNIRLAEYPVCISKNYGAKKLTGDNKTPETTWRRPIHIKEIIDASDWVYDFQDGRGPILAYGDWYLRFSEPYNSVGIHGSTNNEETVPGRYSRGCIRMHDADLIKFKEEYAFVGMKVFIKHEDEGLRRFEYKYY